ncbi:ATP-binding protein [Bosea caraganae]|uniref:ATP-binding protein n=1 Tax=Bosea caraganae TaxID=2763117 RepID=UPI0015F09A16|nr:AAA family ATPase [Bosea caraganae]
MSEPDLRKIASERRYVTIVFVDLVGYTQLSEQLDPEDLRVVQRRYQQLTLTTMERYGGFVASYTGDGVLIFFGYPIARDNDAERAARAALELMERLKTLNTNVGDTTVPQVTARAGIHSGLVVMEPTRLSGGSSELGAVGEAVNLAARVQAEAMPGAVVATREIVELTDGLFEIGQLGARPIRGLSREIEIFQINGERLGTTRRKDGMASGATVLAGREACLERILERWTTATTQKRSQFVQVLGDAGTGKTRVISEICGHPEFANAAILATYCHELFASTPLYPVASFLWARAGLKFEDEDDVRNDKIATLLSEIGMNTPENAEIAASLLGMAATGIREQFAPAPTLFKRKQFEFIISVIARTARRQPTLVVIEDTHWLDPSSAELLRELMATVGNETMLVVATARPFPRGEKLPQTDDSMTLEPLSGEQSLMLARSIPGADMLPAEKIAQAVAAAEGVPLFVEQFVLSLIDEQIQVPNQARRSDVPLLLAQLMSERLDRRPGARPIVQAAACIGRSFTTTFLANILASDVDHVIEPIEALVEAEILMPRRFGAEIRYEFRHSLLQRIAHESILTRERRLIHDRILDLIDRGHGSDIPLPEVIAHHLTEAARFHEAVQAWLQAGLGASQRSAHPEAIEHIRRGLNLLGKLKDPRAQAELELSLQAALIGSITAAQGPTSATMLQCCERGLELCASGERSPQAFPFIFGKFTFANCRGDIPASTALAEDFLRQSEQNTYEAGKAIGHRLIGMVQLGQGEARGAIGHLEHSLFAGERERSDASTFMFGQNTEIHAKSLLSLAHFSLGSVDEALRIGMEALRAADGLRHPHSAAIPMSYVGGWVFGLCNATDALMQEAGRLVALSEQHRLEGFRAHGAAFLGWGLSQKGDHARGAAIMAQAIAGFDSVGYVLSLSGYLANLAHAQLKLGQVEAAEATCWRALQLMSRSGNRWLEPELHRIEALIAEQGQASRRQQAEGLFRHAVARARALNSPVLEYRCLASLRDHLGADRIDGESQLRLAELSPFDALPAQVMAAYRSEKASPATAEPAA